MECEQLTQEPKFAFSMLQRVVVLAVTHVDDMFWPYMAVGCEQACCMVTHHSRLLQVHAGALHAMQVEQGWKRQVFDSIKAIFGYGV
jgi:hypothetical protein